MFTRPTPRLLKHPSGYLFGLLLCCVAPKAHTTLIDQNIIGSLFQEPVQRRDNFPLSQDAMHLKFDPVLLGIGKTPTDDELIVSDHLALRSSASIAGLTDMRVSRAAIIHRPEQLALLNTSNGKQAKNRTVTEVMPLSAIENADADADANAVAPEVDVMPANTVKPTPVWDIVLADKTLNTALARWAVNAGWQLVWELPIDYSVEAQTTIPGSFEEAIGIVASSMETAEIPLKAIFYEGNKVLRIVAKGTK